MKCYVDTSAFFALLDADDGNHPAAKSTFIKLLEDEVSLITGNYVLVETIALIQRRIGFDAVRAFQTDMLPLVHVEFTTSEFHRLGMAALLSASRRNLSLVDCVSFEMMRHLGITSAFTFDAHFAEQGFQPV
jgi:predicted nucleic acid-binding protein